MVKYEFRRDEFKWAKEFYEIMQKRMELPEWFGKNPDALMDMLTGHIETPCEIVLIGFNKSENEYNEYELGLIFRCFSIAQSRYPDEFKITYKDN